MSPANQAWTSFTRFRMQIQVVWVALIGGLAVYSGIAWYMIGRATAVTGPVVTMLYAGGAALSVGAVALAAVLPALARRSLPQQPLRRRLAMVFAMRTIYAASLEGAGLFWATLTFLLQQPLCLAGPALAVVAMAAQFPTASRLEEDVGLSEAEVERMIEMEAAP